MIWQVLFPKLEMLKLWAINFGCCETLALKKCLFSFPMIKSLRRLQHLEISDCQGMEAILNIGECTEEETFLEMIFPSLKFLNLVGLPELEKFCSDPFFDKKVSF